MPGHLVRVVLRTEALINALHQCTQRGLPGVLVGAGLSHLPALAGAAKSYAERMFEFSVIDL